ncbi:MAG: DNA methyltransferase, partial [Paludibacter sp.]
NIFAGMGALLDSTSLDYEIKTPDDTFTTPLQNNSGKKACWRWSKNKFEWGLDNEFVEFKKDKNSNWIVYTKQYLNCDNEGNLIERTQRPFGVIDTFSSTQGAKNLEDIGLSKMFNYSKPSALLKYLLNISTLKQSIILDFFAGSGTTLHATMQLNSEDGGRRQCILVTNNENNICEEVTYERNKRVIQGYTNAKGVNVAGLANNNLRYYRTEFVGSTKTEQNKRLLTQASTDLLCIKEDCYDDITADFGYTSLQCRIFTNKVGKYMVVVYHSRTQWQVCEQLIGTIKTLANRTEKVKLYGFSPEKETLIEDFAEVEELIEAVPLPESIYNAYRATFRILKLDRQSQRD